MISIHHYMVCQVTHEVYVEATVGGDDRLWKVFSTVDEAGAWIETEQAAQLALELVRWISHKQHIATASGWYQGRDRSDALAVAVKLMDRMMNLSLIALCTDVLQIKNTLYKILPAPSNTSFESSKKMLDAMIGFCEGKMKKFQLKKVS